MTEPCLYSLPLEFEKRLLAFLEYLWFVEFWVIDEEIWNTFSVTVGEDRWGFLEEEGMVFMCSSG